MWKSSLIVILVLAGCQSHPERDVESIKDVLGTQAAAWNRGDVAGYMEGYWNDPELAFTGGKSITHGWQQALDRYKKGYPSQAQMGHLHFEDLDIEILSSDVAMTTGAWRLERQQDTLNGRFTLVWKKIDGAWYIIADHSS